jgi:hypothetical protein
MYGAGCGSCLTTDVDEEGSMPLTLFQNIPNPFNPTTSVRYYLPKLDRVTVRIFDVSGREIDCIVDEVQERGFQTVDWNGTDRKGRPVATGVYFLSLTAGQKTLSHKMALIR